MPLPSSLNLVTTKRPTKTDPITARRAKLVERIDDQIALLEASRTGTTFKRVVTRRIKNDETGETETREVGKKIRPWWWLDQSGAYLLSIKYGNKPVELAKGKSTIQCKTHDDVGRVLLAIRQAVVEGEVDQQLKQLSSQIRTKFKG